MINKPGYTTTKQALWLSSAMAWIIIVALTVGAIAQGQVIAFAGLVVPLMVGLIVAILGIHRGFGSLDMWTMTRSATPALPPPYLSRDQPQEDR